MDTKQLRALAEAATPGPWTADVDGDELHIIVGRRAIARLMPRCDEGPANVAYIAALSPARVLRMIDVIQAVEEWAAVASLRDEYKQDEENKLLASLQALKEET